MELYDANGFNLKIKLIQRIPATLNKINLITKSMDPSSSAVHCKYALTSTLQIYVDNYGNNIGDINTLNDIVANSINFIVEIGRWIFNKNVDSKEGSYPFDNTTCNGNIAHVEYCYHHKMVLAFEHDNIIWQYFN
eukprot:312948_1